MRFNIRKMNAYGTPAEIADFVTGVHPNFIQESQESTQVKSESQEVQVNHIKVENYWIKEGTNFTGSVIDDYGNIAYYVNGKLHREDRPAIQYANGTKVWYLHGEHHREEGPAIERTNGTKSWYYNNQCISNDQNYTLEEFQSLIIKHKTKVSSTNQDKISIWGKYRNNLPEVIDCTTKKEAESLAHEYALAYGKDWVIWAGTRDGKNFKY